MDQKQIIGYEEFYHSFYKHFDPSFFKSTGIKIKEKSYDKNAHFIGEGTFFRSFFIRKDNYDFCLKILKEKSLEQTGRLSWIKTLKQLSMLKGPLIAPLGLVSLAKPSEIAVIMPFGLRDLSLLESCWLPLDKTLEETKVFFKKHQLSLEDEFVDILTWKGIPFIADISDILAMSK